MRKPPLRKPPLRKPPLEAPAEEAPAAIELPAVENAPIADITADSGYESDSVILDDTAGNAHIIARRIFQENREYLAVAALDENGSPIWMQETAVDEIGEVNMTDAFIGGIAARPLVMLYNAQQGLAAIDASNGSVRWLLSNDVQNLGAGLCHAVVPGNGIMYIGGFHGPDPVAIDANGNVLWQADSGSDATWLAWNKERDTIVSRSFCMRASCKRHHRSRVRQQTARRLGISEDRDCVSGVGALRRPPGTTW